MSDLDELLNRLKAQHSNRAEPTSPVNLWQQPSPMQQPPVGTPRSVSQVTPSNDQKASNTLLNLLNIRAQPHSPQRAASSFASTPANALTELSNSTRNLPVRLASAGAVPSNEPSSNTQQYLLDLLTKSKPEQTASATVEPAHNKSSDEAGRREPAYSKADDAILHREPAHSNADAQSGRREPAHPKANDEPGRSSSSVMFKYVNPFDQLHASSPLNATPGASEGQIAKAPLSVAEKLETIGQEVGDQAEQALAQAESAGNGTKADVESNWSTAEDEDAKLEEDEKVEVYQFPMKPFVVLNLDRKHVPRAFRLSTWEKSTPVARLKKEFSHDDRCLTTASQAHIIYGVPATDKKSASGVKLIRQDDGKNKHLWHASGERVCSVQIAPSLDGTVEAVLATGINGTMFFTTIPNDEDEFSQLDSAKDGVTMSPPPNFDEPAQPTDVPSIRTRAKLSNTRAATCFAAARGRQIHIIAPQLAKAVSKDARGHVNTEKYLSEYCFSINIAKACKDFCFSDDDTLIASVDKLSKLKFWDVRPLTTAIDIGGSPPKAVLKDALHTIPLAPVNSKADVKLTPSSIIFVDKERAHTKKTALRYVLIGFQQNHVLQLWDLGLGKCVQELRFPASVGTDSDDTEESKGMCSVTYHPKSSIIVVGHPGRNSVYLIHLSAPKYNLAPLSQAAYVAALADKDAKTVPKPDNTAIMSGMREFSFARVGQLRSVDILKTPFQLPSATTEDEVLFEIYAMHSKGVLGIPISKEDLGWDSRGKLIKPVDAIEQGLVVVSDLKDAIPVDDISRTSSGSASSKPQSKPVVSTPTKPVAVHKANAALAVPVKSEKLQTEKASSDKAWDDSLWTDPIKKQRLPDVNTVQPKQPRPSDVNTVQPKQLRLSDVDTVKSAQPRPSHVDTLPSKQLLQNGSLPQEAKATESSHARSDLEDQFSQLYKKLENDKRINEAAGAAKQDAILRLVASTLTENVESSLQRIVVTNIQQQLLPAVTKQIEQIVSQNIVQSLQASVPEVVRSHLESALPAAVDESLRAALSDQKIHQSFASVIGQDVEKQVKRAMQQLESTNSKHNKSISSTIGQIATSSNDSGAELLRRLEESESRVTSLLSAIQQEQSQLRDVLTKAQSANDDVSATKQTEPQQSEEVHHLTKLMNDGMFEQATIEWLQSAQQAELFDQLFVRINPQYLKHVSSLVALSVSAAVSASLESNIEKRLEWLGSVVSNVDVEDQEIRDVAPKIMEVLIQRLQGTYMHISETQPSNQEVLRKLAALNRLISNTRKAFD